MKTLCSHKQRKARSVVSADLETSQHIRDTPAYLDLHWLLPPRTGLSIISEAERKMGDPKAK